MRVALMTPTFSTPNSATQSEAPDVPRSVLRIGDQRGDIFPDRCVLSGVHTTGATRVTGSHPWFDPPSQFVSHAVQSGAAISRLNLFTLERSGVDIDEVAITAAEKLVDTFDDDP